MVDINIGYAEAADILRNLVEMRKANYLAAIEVGAQMDFTAADAAGDFEIFHALEKGAEACERLA